MKEIIRFIFNILKTENIIGIEAGANISYFLIARYLTIKRCKESKISLDFAFENFFKENFSEVCEDEKALLKFYNKKTNESDNCLVEIIKKKFYINDSKFECNIKSPINFANIYHKLNEISDDVLQNFDYIDILATINKELKNTELLEYFTNRKLCEFLVKLVKPNMKNTNETETIIDPFIGTGGLLIESYKYLNKYNKNINWEINKSKLYGFDIQPQMRNCTLFNLLLVTNKIFSNTIIKNDTLFNDYKINDNTILDKVDVILSHMPYGLRNIIYKNVCKRIKELKIDGTKAEPLILQLMIKSLNKNGRCAVIVPDNLLSNDAKLHKQTRIHLLENMNVKKIVSIDDKLLEIDVKSSILFFENNGKTQNIEFSKIKLINDTISEENIINVSYDDIIKNEHSLLVNKYILKTVEVIDNIKYTKLRELCDFKFGEKIKKSENIILDDYNSDNDSEKYYCYNGTEETYYQKKYNREKLNLIISRVKSDILLKLVNDKIWLNENGLTVHNTSTECSQKYINYYLLSHLEELEVCYNSKGVISIDVLGDLLIPLPSIKIQKKITSIIDIYNNKIFENKNSINTYTEIQKNILWMNLLNNTTKTCKLKDILTIRNGLQITSSTSKTNNNTTVENSIIISKFDENTNIKYIKEKFNLNQSTWALSITNKNFLKEYVYIWLWNNQNNLFLKDNNILHQTNFLNTQIFNIDVDIQNKIINEFNYYENLKNILIADNINLNQANIINFILESYNNINENIENIDNLSCSEESKSLKPSSPVLTSLNNIKIKN
jgi:type I restriction-modification system DNA methylase subunit